MVWRLFLTREIIGLKSFVDRLFESSIIFFNSSHLNEWLNEFNINIIKAHWNNPERNKPNYVIKDGFWESKNIEKLPYRRGAIFAFWLDNQILKKSNYTKSLDDFMREILKICTTQNRKFTDQLFLDLVYKYLNKDMTYFFQKHIINGVDFNLENKGLIDVFKIQEKKGIPQILLNNLSNYHHFFFR